MDTEKKALVGSCAFPGNIWSGRRTGRSHRCIFTGLPHAMPLLPQSGDLEHVRRRGVEREGSV